VNTIFTFVVQQITDFCGFLLRKTLLYNTKRRTVWLGGLLVERRTSVSQIRGSIPRQVAAV